MIDQLIIEGEHLETEVRVDGGLKYFFESINFEKWFSKSLLYLENYHIGSSVTDKARTQYKTLDNTNINYNYYQSLLGSLQALQDFERYERNQTSELTF
jgi:hypothetical protein